jgi:SAM-dependent methyltransferase
MPEWWQEFFLSGDYTLLQDIPPERTEAQTDFVVKALGAPPGGDVLDAACGVGRHSLALAARGWKVVGLDYTPSFLQKAKACRQGAWPQLLRGDMRHLPFKDGSFDAAINLFTSFGYLESDEEDAGVLREIGRVLRPGGLFLIDTLNRDGLARTLQPTGWSKLPEGYLLEERKWESLSGRVPTVWTFVRSGLEKSYTVSVRVYTAPELVRMLRSARLEVVEGWGDWEGGPLTVESRRLILKARKV